MAPRGPARAPSPHPATRLGQHPQRSQRTAGERSPPQQTARTGQQTREQAAAGPPGAGRPPAPAPPTPPHDRLPASMETSSPNSRGPSDTQGPGPTVTAPGRRGEAVRDRVLHQRRWPAPEPPGEGRFCRAPSKGLGTRRLRDPRAPALSGGESPPAATRGLWGPRPTALRPEGPPRPPARGCPQAQPAADKSIHAPERGSRGRRRCCAGTREPRVPSVTATAARARHGEQPRAAGQSQRPRVPGSPGRASTAAPTQELPAGPQRAAGWHRSCGCKPAPPARPPGTRRVRAAAAEPTLRDGARPVRRSFAGWGRIRACRKLPTWGLRQPAQTIRSWHAERGPGKAAPAAGVGLAQAAA